MPVGLLVPAFLAGMAALLVPLLLHLRHRERARPRPFPSLMFLARIPVQTDQRRRVTDWPLLLLRALAVALLVLAFTRPFMRGGETPTGDAAGLTVLAIDRSESMSHPASAARWADSARAVIDRLPSGRRVAVLAFDETATVIVAATVDHSEARSAIDRLPEPAGATRYGAVLRAGAQLLSGEAAAGEIVIVTDMQASGRPSGTLPVLPPGTDVVTINVGPDERDNASVVDVQIEPVPGEGTRRSTVAARIVRRGGVDRREFTATLEVDGRKVGERRIALAGDDAATVVFDTVAVAQSDARVAVSIDQSGVPVDDRFFAISAASRPLRVALVLPTDGAPSERRYLESALRLGNDPRIVLEQVARLEQAVLARNDAVVVVDASLAGDVGARLLSWIENGGGAMVMAGNRLGSSRGEIVPGVKVTGSVDRTNGSGVSSVDPAHPVLRSFGESPVAGLGAVSVRRHAAIDAGSTLTVLARFDDGSPALAAGAIGAGRLLVNAIPGDGVRSDFAVSAAFLPLMMDGLSWVAQAKPERSALASHEPVRAPAGATRLAVRGPDGGVTRPAVSGGWITGLRSRGIHQLYDGDPDGPPIALVAVNGPAVEADLALLPAGELLLGVAEGEAPDAAGIAATPEAAEARQRGWRWLILTVLALLTLEVTVASRGWRGIPLKAPAVGRSS